MLENISYIVKRIENFRYENSAIKGEFYNLSKEDIDNISPIFEHEHVEECTDSNSNSIRNAIDLNDYIENKIQIQISTGNIAGYFDTFSSFLSKNKVELGPDSFYIRNIDFLRKEEDECNSEKLKFYYENIKLIKLLRKVSDYEKKVGNDLELFFYKAEKGLTLKIDYDEDDLNNFTADGLTELNNHFFNKPDKEERKQVFINDLIGLLNDDNSYTALLEKWNTLKDTYDKSFRLYLSGFSFEKIKTSSISYFQELTDKIYHQINKATINIFVVPGAYIFFIKSFGVSGNTFQNILLLMTAFIFSLIMHKVVFSNMADGLDAISQDIKTFRSKADANLPAEIMDELNKLESTNLKKQKTNIKLLKYTNWILFLFAFIMFVYAERSMIMHLFDLIIEK